MLFLADSSNVRSFAWEAFEGGGWPLVSDAARDFVRALLIKDSTRRPTASEAMQHAWLLQAGAGGKQLRSPASAFKHSSEVIHEMQAFGSLSRVHKVALELLAFGATTAEVEKLRQLFYAIDTDGSGAISRAEFMAAMGSHPEFSADHVSRLFDQVQSRAFSRLLTPSRAFSRPLAPLRPARLRYQGAALVQ